MRILLQQITTGQFLGENGEWTDVEELAKPFHHFVDALSFAHDHIHGPMAALCVFSDPSYNFSIYLRNCYSALDWDRKVQHLLTHEEENGMQTRHFESSNSIPRWSSRR